MVNQTNFPTQMPIGGGDMSALRRAARENSPEALKAVAQQFEALLMNMVLKSMRDATPKSGLFENDQTKLYTSLYDQQISQNFSKRGIGLADALLRQFTVGQGQPVPTDKSSGAKPASGFSPLKLNEKPLSAISSGFYGNSGVNPKHLPSDELSSLISAALVSRQNLLPGNPGAEAHPQASAPGSSKPAHVRAFQQKFTREAEEASRTTGIPAKFMLGQAALETGWGKKVIVAADGTSSHNLFGIKATKGWAGKTVETTTTEYVNGVAYRKKEKFRAYDSYADSFKDYARLLKSSARYQNVLANSRDATSFAQGLQRAGYATDPQYAAKLTRIIQKSLSA